MRTPVVIAIIGAAAVAAAVTTFRHVDRKYAQPVAELSKMMSVTHILSQALIAYYEQHSSFPRSLDELPLQTLRWGDEGSSARDAKAWSYVSDGLSFTMTWANALGTELFLGGKTGQVFHSRGEFR